MILRGWPFEPLHNGAEPDGPPDTGGGGGSYPT
jgi:hypothetical protein